MLTPLLFSPDSLRLTAPDHAIDRAVACGRFLVEISHAARRAETENPGMTSLEAGTGRKMFDNAEVFSRFTQRVTELALETVPEFPFSGVEARKWVFEGLQIRHSNMPIG